MSFDYFFNLVNLILPNFHLVKGMQILNLEFHNRFVYMNMIYCELCLSVYVYACIHLCI